jgi:hypothetical protein
MWNVLSSETRFPAEEQYCATYTKVGLVIHGVFDENEEYYLLGQNAAQSETSPLTFRRNVLPPASGLKSELSKKLARSMQQADRYSS